MSRIAIIGTSGHAQVVADIIRTSGQHHLIGFLDPNRRKGDILNGLEVLGPESDILTLREQHQIDACTIGVGDNAIRGRIASNLADLGFEDFATVIHPAATIASNVILGSGIVVCAGVCINPGSQIGNHALLNTNSTIDHDSSLASITSVAPGAVLGGGCRVGEGSVIGIGAVLKQGVEIGENTVIGAGSLVLHSFGDNLVAYGSPAQLIRSRLHGEPYLK